MRSVPWRLVLVLVGASFVPVGGAEASCAAPYFLEEGTPRQVTVGDALAVEGRAFVEGCDDMGDSQSSLLGCSDSSSDEEKPFQDVRLEIRQGGRTWVLGETDAGTAEDNRLGHVRWEVALPDAVRAGRAVLVARIPADPGLDVRWDVRVRPSATG